GSTLASWKQAGYFRRSDLTLLEESQPPDLLLLHEWPRGLAERGYIGNPIARDLIHALQPAWVWLGHSHRALGARKIRGVGGVMRYACLDQATEPDHSLIWLEWEGGEAVRGGWGASGEPAGEAFPEIETARSDGPTGKQETKHAAATEE